MIVAILSTLLAISMFALVFTLIMLDDESKKAKVFELEVEIETSRMEVWRQRAKDYEASLEKIKDIIDGDDDPTGAYS